MSEMLFVKLKPIKQQLPFNLPIKDLSLKFQMKQEC